MPFDRFIWSLIAPTGFRTATFANEGAFDTAVKSGDIQDPRGGLMSMLYPTGTAKPPIKIVAVNTPPSLSFNFSLQQVSNDGAVTGFTGATYFFEDGSAVADADGAITKVFARDGIQIVRVILNDGRRASLTVEGNPTDFAPANTALPAISGPNPPQVGVASSSSTGTWTGNPTPTYARQWRAAGVDIPGATGTSYTPVVGDVGKVLSCRVTATNSKGVVSATTANTVAVIAA